MVEQLNDTNTIDNSWFKSSSSQFLIAGPCSAESESQVLRTAVELSHIGAVNVYRAGIWKPRTRPGNFEGVGEIGLSWLQKVKSLTGLKTTVEVTLPSHVEKCLKAGIDMLWIGARTSVNPIMMQELAMALKGVDVPVLV